MPNFICIICLFFRESFSSFSSLDIKLSLALGLARIDGCVWSAAKCPLFNEALSNLMFLIPSAEEVVIKRRKT